MTKFDFSYLKDLPLPDRIEEINSIRKALHEFSPFKTEPVDCVIWVKTDEVIANDYNPNTVAPPEMKLLECSILEDGYTQPIVSWKHNGLFEVVDGFHRNRVGRECPQVKERIKGYLPLTIINDSRADRGNRIAATIRHNRARGKHQVESMSDIVIELKHRNWSNERISRELGMDQDEILRLCQITGLTELFADQEFSKSWYVEGEVTETDFQELTDDIKTYGQETMKFRTVNTSDKDRTFHTFDKWECFKAGFYSTTHPKGWDKNQCEQAYRKLLSDPNKFSSILKKVICEWKYSCEHYLTNKAMNRIAWLGQAAACYAEGIPSCFRNGFNLLSEKEQKRANEVALKYLNKWLKKNKYSGVTMEEAYSFDRESQIY
jgi:ParB-like chromosome segregation protein Spo0J